MKILMEEVMDKRAKILVVEYGMALTTEYYSEFILTP
jgi:hypothetical protein